MLEITPHIAIPDEDIQLDFVQASGPGGQNVNKVASAVQLRFNTQSAALPENLRQRLLRLAGKRVNEKGELLIEARRYRTQEQNRIDALQRLTALLQQAAKPPKVRKKTRVPAHARQSRLEAKKRLGEKKRLRRRANYPEE